MSKAIIDSWINRDGEYEEGLSLFLRFGNSQFLKDLLAAGETAFNRSKLRKELIALSDTFSDGANEEKKTAKAITDEEYKRMPPEGIELQSKWKKMYAEMNALRHSLMDPITESKRHSIAIKILELDVEIRKAWSKIDFWRKYGEFPKEVYTPDNLRQMPLLDLIRRKQNLATYISKFRDLPSKADQVSAWKIEMLKIQEILDNGTI